MVGLHLELSRTSFDALMLQLSKHIHDLRDRLQAATYSVQADASYVAMLQSDLAQSETIRELLKGGAYYKTPYIEPEYNHDPSAKQG